MCVFLFHAICSLHTDEIQKTQNCNHINALEHWVDVISCVLTKGVAYLISGLGADGCRHFNCKTLCILISTKVKNKFELHYFYAGVVEQHYSFVLQKKKSLRALAIHV